MHSSGLILVCLLVMPTFVPALPHKLHVRDAVLSSDAKPQKKSFSVPIRRREISRAEQHRRDDTGDEASGSIGLGNIADKLYTVPIQIGDSITTLQMDTGSSDLWVASDACNTDICKKSTAARYPIATFSPSGTNVTMNYGDSKTGSFASGPVGKDAITIAGLAVSDQQFVAVDNTTNPTISFGTAGIFGLGFPGGSVVQQSIVNKQFNTPTSSDQFLASTFENGPLLSRLVSSGELDSPLFAVTLSRDTVDIGGVGQLTVGKLPDGVDNSTLTWVPVRLYSQADGGLAPPTFAPTEVYPFRWEIPLDGVFFDGQKVADSTIPAEGTQNSQLTGLIDTGNSLLRGPKDVVSNILSGISPSLAANATAKPLVPCSVPHTMAFQIGGKMFPVDPRDFISSVDSKNTQDCVASSMVSGDAPSKGALFSWSLGDPFLKSNVVAFHYGNLTHPSVDPPRIGFLSTVPANVNQVFADVMQGASQTGGLESTSQVAPTASATSGRVTTISISSMPIASASVTLKPNTNAKTSSADSIRFGISSSLWTTVFAIISYILLFCRA